MTSAREDAARAAKAAALADAFDKHARNAASTCGGRRARVKAAGVPIEALVASMAKAASENTWVDLAASEGIRTPSPRTIAVTVRLLELRAKLAGTDPLEGLPT